MTRFSPQGGELIFDKASVRVSHNPGDTQLGFPEVGALVTKGA